MAVTLLISETSGGGALSDSLAGGELGVDIGNVTNGSYAPIGTTQAANDGKQWLIVRHDAVANPITDCKIYISSMADALTGGNTYGGAKTAAQDFTDLSGMGLSTGTDKTNADGLSSGIWLDMDHLVNDTNRFDLATRPTLVKAFGQSSQGISAATGYTLHEDSMLYWNGSTEADATTPVAGSIGISTDTVLGNRSKLQTRLYIASAWPDGGRVQWAYSWEYSHTN